ncbi:hypothetical protein FACS1894137_11990 [Spirochaetia bacterium]|nr:hypothetical protein FACS1894137_11990 [Spirochaetia bacterium]
MSKAFSLANFRVGYLIASAENVNLISRVRNPKNVSTFAQEAAIAALSDIDYMMAYTAEVHNARRYFVESLALYHDNMKLYIGSGNFILVKMISAEEKRNICDFLFARNILVRELSQSINLLHCFRITIGTIKQMEKVAVVIGDYFRSNRN